MFRVEEEKVYEWNISVACSKGEKRSAYLVIILLDKDKKQVRRQQRFIRDFSDTPKDYSIVTQIPSGVKYAILAYRVNCEGAVPAHTIIKFPPIKSCSLELSSSLRIISLVSGLRLSFSGFGKLTKSLISSRLVFTP